MFYIMMILFFTHDNISVYFKSAFEHILRAIIIK